MTPAKQKEVIDWAIQKLQDYENEKKLYNLSAITLSILDVLCGIISIFYAGMMATSIVASILCGTVWGARYIQLVKARNLAKALRLLSVPSIAYLAARKRRGELMRNIKIKNWIVAGLNIAAVIVGIVLVFVEPNIITENIEAVICGLGSLLGVNVAIPCFNNAKVTAEEKAEKVANKQLKLAKKEAKAALKAEQEAQINAKTTEILNARAEAANNDASVTIETANVENQVINADHVEINNAEIQNATLNTQN